MAENDFAFTIDVHVTFKDGSEMKGSELCVYEVKDEKIISERFY